jgi:hypothetical protein
VSGRLLEEIDAESRRRGKAAEHDGPHPCHIRVCRLHRDPRPQPGNAVIAELTERGFVSVETNRQEQGGLLPIEKAEFLWHNTDDLARFAVHPNRSSHNRSIRAEAALPIVIAEHDRVGPPRAVIDAIKPASKNRGEAENRKNAIGHIERLHLLGIALAGNTN